MQQVDLDSLYDVNERIGRGAFGEVFKGLDKSNRRLVAIKRIDLEEALDELEDIQQEISILSQCDSPYITKYYGSYLKGTKLWIIMEFMGGGSALEIRKAVKIEEPYIATILHEVLMGLAYLHGEGKLHRDIKGMSSTCFECRIQYLSYFIWDCSRIRCIMFIIIFTFSI